MNEQRYKRREEYDRRDNTKADAWEDTNQTVDGGSWQSVNIVYTAVGHDPNKGKANGKAK